MRALRVVAVLLALLVPLGWAMAHAESAPLGPARTGPMSTSELIEALALDLALVQLGPSVEAGPGQMGAPFTAPMLAAWTEAARRLFAPQRMVDRLAALLDDKFRPGDYVAYARFFGSAVGQKIVSTDRAIAALEPAELGAIHASGGRLASEASERRREQVAQLMELFPVEMSLHIARQSARGMLIGLWLADRPSDIEVPWEEVESQLELLMPQLEADMLIGQTALAHYSFRDLSDADLDAYIRFLRSEPARRLYAVATHALGEVVAENMAMFGEEVARRLRRVSV